MVAERVGRPVLSPRPTPPSRQQPVGRAAMQSPGGNRGPEFDEEAQDEYDGNTGAARPPAGQPATPQRDTTSFESLGGVGQYNNGGQVPKESPTARGPSARTSAEESPVLSSASDSGSTLSRFVTRSDFQRVKRRLVNMSEHLRDSLQTTTSELWEAIDDEVKERKQESPLFQRLLNARTEVISHAVRANLDGLRDEMLTLIAPIAQLTEGWQLWGESIESKLESLNSRTETLASNLAIVADRTQESLEHVSTSLAELHHKIQSDWSDWSLADTDEYQELKARIEAWRLVTLAYRTSGQSLALKSSSGTFPSAWRTSRLRAPAGYSELARVPSPRGTPRVLSSPRSSPTLRP